MKSFRKALEEARNIKRPTNLYVEFQEFGVYLAESLDDPKHTSLYIKFAKEYPRNMLEEALTYTKGYTSARSKAKIFMWKLKDLKKASL